MAGVGETEQVKMLETEKLYRFPYIIIFDHQSGWTI